MRDSCELSARRTREAADFISDEAGATSYRVPMFSLWIPGSVKIVRLWNSRIEARAESRCGAPRLHVYLRFLRTHAEVRERYSDLNSDEAY